MPLPLWKLLWWMTPTHTRGCVIEVERAAALLRSIGLDKQIRRVDTAEDNIVYAGTTAEAFVCFSIYSSDITALTTAAGQ